jgi:hypothetical protein
MMANNTLVLFFSLYVYAKIRDEFGTKITKVNDGAIL